MFLDQIVANYVPMQRLTWGLSFVFTPSLYLYVDDLQDSFVGIAAARLSPRASTTSKNHISLPTFSGITHISMIASTGTTLPSQQHRQRISNRSSMSKNICKMRIVPIANSVLSWFQTTTTRRLKHHLSYHIPRNPRAHLSDKLTWQFMSAALLRNNKACNELEDNREWCLHVLT